MAWEVYGEGGGQFNNLKDARQCAKEFSLEGNETDGYGIPGEVSIWKDGTLFMTYSRGKLVYDGWTIKNYTYKVKNLETLEEETVTVDKKLKLDRVYNLSDGRRIQPLRLLTTKDKEGVKDSSDDEVNSYVPPKQEYNKVNNSGDDSEASSTNESLFTSMSMKKLKECLHTEMFNEAFKVNSELNPNLFDNNSGEMYNDVRVRLCEIADMFVENIQEDEVPIKVYDYWLVGSNAAYNYSPESDIDVHIIVDMKETKVNPYLLRLLYDYIKSSFNDKYDIMVKGHEVELYLEDIETSAVTNGIYSLKQAKWIKQPEKQEEREYNIEDSELYSIVYDKYINLRDEDAEEFLDNLYVMRKESLVADGEFGEGNLVFKQFRNNGYIDDIKEKKYKFKSQELTLENFNDLD